MRSHGADTGASILNVGPTSTSDSVISSSRSDAAQNDKSQGGSFLKTNAVTISQRGNAKRHSQDEQNIAPVDFVMNAISGMLDSPKPGTKSVHEENSVKTPTEAVGKQKLKAKPLPLSFFSDERVDKMDQLYKEREVAASKSFLDASISKDRVGLTSKATRPRLVFGQSSPRGREYHSSTTNFESKQKRFAEGSNLPPGFFDDISFLKNFMPQHLYSLSQAKNASDHNKLSAGHNVGSGPEVDEQMKLLHRIRELEAKLSKARQALEKSLILKKPMSTRNSQSQKQLQEPQKPVLLTKEDYVNLVDLYYYSYNNRFSPESTDGSPTPLLLDDYSFTLSADFSPGERVKESVNEDEVYESPLKKVAEMLRRRQLREVAVMQVFVDLLIDDYSSNRALYEAYKELPTPGVAYLPKGILRLFLQRMSTPWTLSEKSMLRYLSLIDDMQKARIPITSAEWSSAVYLAGRAFSKVTSHEVGTSFQIWRTMESEANVRADNVTFNILFDIAVRAGKFALGETILKEMHARNLRLNRLGRVSLMYYHGLRRDGDGVRKVYRDFVEAGEIVDTLVLNCVISSLLNAQEPQAAEQVYARMKNLQSQLRKGVNRDGEETLYKRYPDPESNMIDQEMASNYLGRVLGNAPHLREVLPGKHEELQNRMPLTPDHITFRSMIAYHATVSGDLDRLTLLLQEMTDQFQLPLQTITFQLLFKGFAIHGPIGGPHSIWSARRLDMCWKACRDAIKASGASKPAIVTAYSSPDSSQSKDKEGEDRPPFEPTLPSITQLNAIPDHASLPEFLPKLSRPPPRRLSGWSEFVLDLAAFPRERLKRLERFHATMFDAEDVVQPHEKPGPHTFESPFFQSNAYTAPEPQLDVEEGEYTLPNPAGTGLLHQTKTHDGVQSPAPETGDMEALKGSSHEVAATKALICWLLRAYARNTKSRVKVEEVWGQARKIYKPQNAEDRDSVVRVVRRCLRDCDREGGDK